jgi:hypothetical protein
MTSSLVKQIVEILKPQEPPWHDYLRKEVVEGLQAVLGEDNRFRVISSPQRDGFRVDLRGECGWSYNVLKLWDQEGEITICGDRYMKDVSREGVEKAILDALKTAEMMICGCRHLGH